MGEGVRSHGRTCAICGRHVRIANFARRSHFVSPGWAQTDTHALSHLTPAEKAVWWTLPRTKWDPHTQAQTSFDPYRTVKS